MTLAPVTDLKYFLPVRHLFGNVPKEMIHVLWQIDIFSSHGLHAHAHVSPLRRSFSGRPQCQKLHLSRPVSLYGLCSTDVSGKSPRYRSMSSCTATEAVSHGNSRHSSKVKSRRCKRTAGLAYICQSCPCINHHGANPLQKRPIRDRSATDCVCTGCHYYRPVSDDVPMGCFPPEQSSHQIAYTSGSAGQHPYIHLYFRRHRARRQHSRHAPHRTGSLLCNGQRVSGVCQTLCHITISRFLCNPRKSQYQMSKNLFSSSRSVNRPPVRSDNHAYRILFVKRLSKQIETHQILRCRNRQNFVFLTNNFSLPALTIAQLYRCRWQVELFFKWIKQNLRIKNFYGTSENAVKTQIWIAVSIYVIVAILKKQLNIPASLYTILQILSVSVFERIPLSQLLTEVSLAEGITDSQNQLNLFT